MFIDVVCMLFVDLYRVFQSLLRYVYTWTVGTEFNGNTALEFLEISTRYSFNSPSLKKRENWILFFFSGKTLCFQNFVTPLPFVKVKE
jgi:hypothetical protein